jgi:transposase
MMSLPPDDVLTPIPEETRRIAQDAFPHGSLAIRLRDLLGTIYHDGMFADLYAAEGQPGATPWRLALVTVLQYAENLSDGQAADAVRARIDWKYALALPLSDAGFDASVLSTFRERLVAGGGEERLLWAMVEACGEQGLLAKRGKQRTDATYVLAAVRRLNRLELVGETLRAALETLAVAAPAWVQRHVPPTWVERYGRRIEDHRLPEGREAQRAWAELVGRDGADLLAALTAPEAPAWLRELPALTILDQVWAQQYDRSADTPRWRRREELPRASELIISPYDAEMRLGKKGDFLWEGGKAHLHETCDATQPHLIIAVQTTDATVPDALLPERLWADLAVRDLLPGTHLADTGYVSASALAEARRREIDLIGPAAPATSWQARAGEGFAATDFVLDWEHHQATCPAGQTTGAWWTRHDQAGKEIIYVRFDRATCAACPLRASCTRGAAEPRTLMLLPQELHEARQAALARQRTPAFTAAYQARAGIEGTIGQGVRVVGLRRARYRGLAKLHLQHCAEAAAIDAIRVVAWHDGRPRAKTRRSHLTRLFPQAA